MHTLATEHKQALPGSLRPSRIIRPASAPHHLRLTKRWKSYDRVRAVIDPMKLPPEVEFYEDVRLLVWRPHGLLNQSAVNKIITVVGELEFSLKEPFNRFADTLAADAHDLNFEYIIRVSLYRRHVYAGRPPVKSVI